MIAVINDQNYWVFSSVSLAAFFALGHNLWLVAKNQKSKIRIEVKTSDEFPESDSAVKPERIKDFRVVSSAPDSAPITNYRIENDSLVADVESLDNQSFYAAIELLPHSITLSAEKFANYMDDEDAWEKVAPRFVKNITTDPQRESYAKFAKVYCESNSFETDDAFSLKAGHKLEIVPQTVFSDLRERGKLEVLVLFNNDPAKDLRVSCGCAGVNNGKYLNHARTDENGRAIVDIPNAGHWFVRTHFIRRHQNEDSFEWESFWASLVFVIK